MNPSINLSAFGTPLQYATDVVAPQTVSIKTFAFYVVLALIAGAAAGYIIGHNRNIVIQPKRKV
jgi:hypothetical protein